MGFYSERAVEPVRKPRPCLGCGKRIGAGEGALECAGHYDGDFWSATYHTECRRAEQLFNDIHGAMEWIPINEIEPVDWPWLIEESPAVADRMAITTERFQALEARRQKRRFRAAIAKATEPEAA